MCVTDKMIIKIRNKLLPNSSINSCLFAISVALFQYPPPMKTATSWFLNNKAQYNTGSFSSEVQNNAEKLSKYL
jgi:hypothetical protein